MQERSEEFVLYCFLTFPSDFDGVREPSILALRNVCDVLHRDGMMLQVSTACVISM